MDVGPQIYDRSVIGKHDLFVVINDFFSAARFICTLRFILIFSIFKIILIFILFSQLLVDVFKVVFIFLQHYISLYHSFSLILDQLLNILLDRLLLHF